MSSSHRGLFSSLADKAQGFIEQTPLKGKLHAPSTGPSQATQEAEVPATAPGTVPAGAPEQHGALGGTRHHGLGAIQHQLRSLQVQYTSGASQDSRQIQLLVTAQKGVSLDFDAVGRDAKAQSKELYLWGQSQGEDIKDVTDRLAYLNYVQGALSYTLATDVDKSRTAWKNVRDAETALAPRRVIRKNFEAQISKIQSEGGRTGGQDTKLQQLEEQFKKAKEDDAPLERELEMLKRAAIKESETIKWKALKEYGQKLVLLAGASEQLVAVLPSAPVARYEGGQQTAAVRAALQRALDSGYTPSVEHLPLNTGHLSHNDETRSFGETHAHELSTISTVSDHGHQTPKPYATSPEHHDTLPINPAALNNTPAPIPAHSTSQYSPPSSAAPIHPPSDAPPSAFHPPSGAPAYAPPVAPPPTATSNSSLPPPAHAPTVAETGVPVVAGAGGPGPISGTLAHSEKDEARDRPSIGYGVGSPDHPNPYDAPPPASEYHDPSADARLVASGSIRRPETQQKYETAEEEKKRLEREEREKILHGDGQPKDKHDSDAPPAYADYH